MAASTALPGSSFRVDCSSVQLGSQREASWASAPERRLARAWAPLAAGLEGRADTVVWMPAHCEAGAVGVRRLGDGSVPTECDRQTNALVDELAKAAAAWDRIPVAQRKSVARRWDRVTAMATWIGQATVLANAFPDPRSSGRSGSQSKLRDNEGRRIAAPARSRKRARPEAPASLPQVDGRAAGDLSGCPRWEALRRRVAARESSRRMVNGDSGWSW